MPSMKMTNKIPPAFDGRVQTIGWFAYEESVEEWESITTIEPRLRGPMLRNRLTGSCLMLKPLFDTMILQDPERGVQYFLQTLRPHFIKDGELVFLLQFLRFMNKERKIRHRIVDTSTCN